MAFNTNKSAGLILVIFILTSAIPVMSGGMITAMHLLALVVLPVLLSYVKHDRFLRRAWLFAIFWALAQVVIDRWHGAELPNQIEIFAAATVLTLTVLIWLRGHWGASVQSLVLCAGLSWLGLELLAGYSLSSSNPWKYGLAGPITVTVLSLVYAAGASRWVPVLALTTLGAVSVVFDSRSQAGFMLMAAVVMAVRRLRFNSRPGGSRGLMIAVLGVALAGYLAYPIVAVEGLIGQRAQTQQVQYNAEHVNFILANRLEFSQLGYLTAANLPFGIGAYEPVDEVQSVASLDFVSSQVAPLNNNDRAYLAYPEGKYVGYNAHSATLASALYGGIPALLAWMAFLVYIVRGLMRAVAGGVYWRGLDFILGSSLCGTPYSRR